MIWLTAGKNKIGVSRRRIEIRLELLKVVLTLLILPSSKPCGKLPTAKNVFRAVCPVGGTGITDIGYGFPDDIPLTVDCDDEERWNLVGEKLESHVLGNADNALDDIDSEPSCAGIQYFRTH